MISEYLFNTIKNAIPEVVVGSITHVYPQTLPEGQKPDVFITYNLLRNSQTFGLTNAVYQISIFAKSYSVSEGISQRIQGLFAHKIWETIGDPLATNSGSIVEQPFDRESGYYMRAVDIIINTKKEIENHLQ